MSDLSINKNLHLLTVYLIGELCERGATPEIKSPSNEPEHVVEIIEITSQDGQLRFNLMVVSNPSGGDLPPVLWEVWKDETCLASGELFLEVLNQDLETAWEAWCSTCCEWGIQRFPSSLLEEVEEFATYYDLD